MLNIVQYCDDLVNLEQELTRSEVNHNEIKQRIEISGVNVSELHNCQPKLSVRLRINPIVWAIITLKISK